MSRGLVDRIVEGAEPEVDNEDKEITYCEFSSDLKNSLSDILDADYDLLSKLRRVLTDRQYDSLRRCKGYDRNDKLMEMVNLLPQEEFFKALVETGQEHVVNFLKHELSIKAGGVNETCWPLTKEQRNVLKSNLDELAKSIDVTSLLPKLLASSCITEVHYSSLTAITTPYECNVRFLEILLKRSQADYVRLIQELNENGQHHLASILVVGGGVVAIHTELAESRLEDEVIAAFPQWWKRASQERRQQFVDLFGSDMQLCSTRKGSVVVCICCKTLSAVQRLDQMLKDGTLKSAVGSIFSSVLDGRHVEVTKLLIDESSYNACLHFFYRSMGFYDIFLVCDPHNATDVMEQRACSPSIKELPLELLENVLIKAVILIFKHLMKLMSTDADNLAVAMVLMVCDRWRALLENRPFTKKQIKGTLDQVCRPLQRRIESCRQSLLVTNEDGSKSHVRGVATLDNKLFVVTEYSSTVCVFDLTSFTLLQNIELKGCVYNPPDIATCEFARRIYIAEPTNQCVWRIDWLSSSSSLRSTASVTDNSSPAVKFIYCEDYVPFTLSTSGRRQQLLVTGVDQSLNVYNVNGKLLRRVELSNEVDDDGVEWLVTLHALQATADDNYFLCRTGLSPQYPSHAEVAEYNSTGQRVRNYYSGPRGDGPQQVNYPEYMSLIGDGRLLVIDSMADRVLLLNTELKLERILLTRQQLNVGDDSRRLKLCYNAQTGLLCVGMANGRVNVFKIHRTCACVSE